MSVIYRTAGPWGAGVGRNLTAAEIDSNFYDQQQHLSSLEDSRPQPDDIISASTVGTQLTFHLESGATLGPVQMPVLYWRWRGEWQPSTSYAALDTFSVADTGLFLALLDHTSPPVFDPNFSVVIGGGAPQQVYQQLLGVGTGAGLDDLTDVAITSPLDGHFLTWDDATDHWINRSPTAATALLGAFAGDSGTGGTKGLVPAPTAGDGAARRVLGASGNWEDPRLPGGIVANLPAAGQAGRRRYVTDATATTFASVVAGGGGNTVPVMDTGSSWIIG